MGHISYLRVSTKAQEDSGLGIEAQRASVLRVFGKPDHEFVEVESGKKNNRPVLTEAIELSKKTGHTLVIARLDRLSRNVAFIATLMDSGIKFKCADLPELDSFTAHIFAAMAQRERELISSRTKGALQRLKEKGVKLGGPDHTKSKEALAKARAAREYYKPDSEKVNTLKKLHSDGYRGPELINIARQILGPVSTTSVYKYLRS